MPTPLIQQGIPTVILQNVVYALPARNCMIQSLAAVQTSLDGSTWANLVGSETTGVETVAPWVRCATGNTTIICKPN